MLPTFEILNNSTLFSNTTNFFLFSYENQFKSLLHKLPRLLLRQAVRYYIQAKHFSKLVLYQEQIQRIIKCGPTNGPFSKILKKKEFQLLLINNGNEIMSLYNPTIYENINPNW